MRLSPSTSFQPRSVRLSIAGELFEDRHRVDDRHQVVQRRDVVQAHAVAWSRN